MFRSVGFGQCQQIAAQPRRLIGSHVRLEFRLGGPPEAGSFPELALTGRGQGEGELTRIRSARSRLHQILPLQGLERSQQRGSIHAEQLRELRHGRVIALIQKDQNGELGAGEVGLGQVPLVEPGDPTRSLPGREAVAGAEACALLHGPSICVHMHFVKPCDTDGRRPLARRRLPHTDEAATLDRKGGTWPSLAQKTQ